MCFLTFVSKIAKLSYFRGRKMGLKLKRLDSGEVSRGGGVLPTSGRGSRGGPGSRGRKSNFSTDYLYYLQQQQASELASR